MNVVRLKLAGNLGDSTTVAIRASQVPRYINDALTEYQRRASVRDETSCTLQITVSMTEFADLPPSGFRFLSRHEHIKQSDLYRDPESNPRDICSYRQTRRYGRRVLAECSYIRPIEIPAVAHAA